MLAPDREDGDVGGAEVLLEPRVEGDVGLVVAQQVELDVLVARALHQRVVEMPGLGWDAVGVDGAGRVLPSGQVEGERGGADPLAVSLAVGRPVGADGGPELRAETFLVRVAVLRDNGRDGVRACQGQAQRRRGAVVEDVDGEAGDFKGVQEGLDGARQARKAVFVVAFSADGGEAEAGQVGRDHAVVGREEGDQIAEHKGRRREAVQEEHDGRRRRAGAAVKHLDAVSLFGGYLNLRHWNEACKRI